MSKVYTPNKETARKRILRNKINEARDTVISLETEISVLEEVGEDPNCSFSAYGLEGMKAQKEYFLKRLMHLKKLRDGEEEIEE